MKIGILYGSTRGNTHIVVSALQAYFQVQSHQVELMRAYVTQELVVDDYDLLIFACGTYGHGLLQEEMAKTLKKYLKDLNLTNTPCATIGLGDDKYDKEYHIESAALLSAWIQSHHGKEIIQPLKINKSPLPHVKTIIKQWGDKLLNNMKSCN